MRHAWTAICRSVRYGWLDGWSDGELPAAAGGSRRGGYPGRAARAHPAAGWLDGHDGRCRATGSNCVHSGMRSAISTDAAAGPGTGSRRAAGPRPDAADQGAIRGTFCRQASGARECRSPTVGLLSIPARAAASAWARTDLGHVLSPRDQKWGRWMCRLSCLVGRIPPNRSGISATACFRGCSLSLLEGRLPARE